MTGTNRRIDLRSDTVTQPTEAMRRAMVSADVGDDVYGEDPTVARLEARVAGMLGLEAGLLMCSGTQSNLTALMSHCQRGEGFISGTAYHVNTSEAGGAAVLGSLVPHPIPVGEDGTMAVEAIEAAIQPDDFHRPPTRLISVENTVSGRVMPPGYVGEVVGLARSRGLVTHLDGARLFNAAVATDTDARDLVAGVDSVSVCLSKGLGAPAGTVLAGNRDFIRRARRLRKMLGGGMRQAGILAAAGLHALDAHIGRLAEDHAVAARLGEALAELVPVRRVSTNMVHADLAGGEALRGHLARRGILVSRPGPNTRLVVHMDIMPEDIGRIRDAMAEFAGTT